MKGVLRVGLLLAAACLPAAAYAQGAKMEIGSSLASVAVGVGENDSGTIFGIPSGGFGLTNPGVYASFFVLPRLAVEPQLGLIVASFDSETTHLLNAAGQVNFFLSDAGRPAAYVLGSAGIIDLSGDTTNPKSVSVGLGYRIPVGGNLAFRLDGRYTRFIVENDGSNTIAFTFAIAGLFGRS